MDYQVPVSGIEGSLAAIGAIIFSLCLAYVFAKIFTIGVEDEKFVESAESTNHGDAIISEEMST